MVTLSVIIPAHNEEKYIRTTLHSLQLQTFQDFEVIVVANGCSDGTEGVVRRRVTMHGNVRLCSLPRAQVSAARNYGAQNARGEILVFLDADTQLDADALQKMYAMFGSREGTKGYGVGTTRVRPDVSKLKYSILMFLKNVFIRSGLYKGCSGVLICRRDDFLSVGGYDEQLAVREHRKLIVRLLKLGKYVCVPVMATTSMRRFEKWGGWRIFFFWVSKWGQDKFGDLRRGKYENVR